MASQTNFREGEICKVEQGEKTYDAVFLKAYKNDKYSFILGDNLLDSDYPLTVAGKPMLIASTRECANPGWMRLWNTATNKTAIIHERIVFKFPEKSPKKSDDSTKGNATAKKQKRQAKTLKSPLPLKRQENGQKRL